MPRHRTVSDVMTTHVHVASPLTPFKLLVRLIEENRVGAIPIVNQQGIPIGIVSESDLLIKQIRPSRESLRELLHVDKRRTAKAKADGTVASDIMTSPVITVESDTGLGDAARLMQEKNLRRLVVVDEGDRIAGIVSRSDVLKVFLRTDDEIREEIRSELIPSLLMSTPDAVNVDVQWNVVTFSGEVDRRSEADIVTRLAGELDGVVGVVDQLTYRWDDAAAAPVTPVSQQRHFRAI
jgi:CBS domain-containing protein